MPALNFMINVKRLKIYNIKDFLKIYLISDINYNTAI